ncbi:MAG: hypothetical protein LBH04_06060 [Tannerellaceae bacterium]|jgi:hypothetical protein|nr:hypothetical protein [Tannerellaceae bacterium]
MNQTHDIFPGKEPEFDPWQDIVINTIENNATTWNINISTNEDTPSDRGIGINAIKNRRRTVHYALRQENMREKKEPWSNIQSLIISRN